MTLDAGTIVGLAFVLVFFGLIVWAELHSRHRRRSKKDETGGASRNGTEEESGEPSRKG